MSAGAAGVPAAGRGGARLRGELARRAAVGDEEHDDDSGPPLACSCPGGWKSSACALSVEAVGLRRRPEAGEDGGGLPQRPPLLSHRLNQDASHRPN
uniref:Uncharacterized protein n=1 Tax=Oryza nivara TaxID=4536 RepID=A0A0E0FFV3_ORYNI